ncbi:MAG TPA: energy transducer TonB [Pyrinomonadaceae bacterium]|nr:energy transducer TonB [Pyrinomonadaceae bacterium]
MRRTIIHLAVALLTFAVGSVLGLLFQCSPTRSALIAQRPTASAPEPPAILRATPTEHCACGNSLESNSPAASESFDSGAPISGGILNGHAIMLPSPPYPAIARAARATGNVPVEVLIDEEGVVECARALGGHPLLQSAAVKAACTARFAPTRLNGKPVKVRGVLAYNFVLQ